MTQIPAGWYADPAPAAPGTPPLHRWWDGERWTDHVQPAAPLPTGYPTGRGRVLTTPDGQPLAGWGRRLVALLIDGLIQLPLAIAIGWPFVSRVVGTYEDYFRDVMDASRSGSTPPSSAHLMGSVMGPMLGYTAVAVLVSLLYNAGFLKALQATPGKLALGLRVRLRERPGRMSWGTVLLRWLTQNAATVLGIVPFVGSVAALYPLLDGLWPLWDDKRQALHDKAARTNVVRTR
jgi:uncharacterized RDD family membrane protein YckC